MENLRKQISEPQDGGFFSDSEAYESHPRTTKHKLMVKQKESTLTAVVAEEHVRMDLEIGDRIGSYDDSATLMNLVESMPTSKNLLKNNKVNNSKAHSLDSFRTEPECLSDPPSLDGGKDSPQQSPFFADEFNARINSGTCFMQEPVSLSKGFERLVDNES